MKKPFRTLAEEWEWFKSDVMPEDLLKQERMMDYIRAAYVAGAAATNFIFKEAAELVFKDKDQVQEAKKRLNELDAEVDAMLIEQQGRAREKCECANCVEMRRKMAEESQSLST
jgi:hypothetical protein